MPQWLRSKGKDLVGVCPECGAPKLNYRPEKGAGICNACHATFSRRSIIRAGFPPQDNQPHYGEGAPKKEIKSSPEKELRSCLDGAAKLAVEGLRGWDTSEGWTSTCHYCPQDLRLYFDLTATSPNAPPLQTSRSIWPSQRGWVVTGSRRGYFYGILPQNSDTIILMEGINDVIGSGLYGKAIAMLGTTLGADVQAHLFAKGFRNIIIWLDPDAAGLSGAAKLKKQLRGIFPSVKVLFHPVEPKKVSKREALMLCASL